MFIFSAGVGTCSLTWLVFSDVAAEIVEGIWPFAGLPCPKDIARHAKSPLGWPCLTDGIQCCARARRVCLVSVAAFQRSISGTMTKSPL
jgi:hypothetical protein